VRRADNLTTFMCRLSWNLGASPSWNHQGLSRPVMRLLYLYILHLLKSSTCVSSSGGLRRNCIYAASGIVTVCRWLFCAPVKKGSSFLTGAQDIHLQRVTIPEAAYIQLRRRPPEDEQGNARNM